MRSTKSIAARRDDTPTTTPTMSGVVKELSSDAVYVYIHIIIFKSYLCIEIDEINLHVVQIWKQMYHIVSTDMHVDFPIQGRIQRGGPGGPDPPPPSGPMMNIITINTPVACA